MSVSMSEPDVIRCVAIPNQVGYQQARQSYAESSIVRFPVCRNFECRVLEVRGGITN